MWKYSWGKTGRQEENSGLGAFGSPTHSLKARLQTVTNSTNKTGVGREEQHGTLLLQLKGKQCAVEWQTLLPPPQESRCQRSPNSYHPCRRLETVSHEASFCHWAMGPKPAYAPLTTFILGNFRTPEKDMWWSLSDFRRGNHSSREGKQHAWVLTGNLIRSWALDCLGVGP